MKVCAIAPASFAANCYLVIEGDEALVVDPAVSLTAIRAALAEQGAHPVGIVLTHGHFDHVLSLDELHRTLPHLPIYIHRDDASYLADGHKNAFYTFYGEDRAFTPADRLLGEGDTVPVGGASVRVLHTPGHTPGSICLLCGEHLITGDTLFDGDRGRDDLYGGSHAALMNSLDRLATLDPDLPIYPGHGNTAKLGAALARVDQYGY